MDAKLNSKTHFTKRRFSFLAPSPASLASELAKSAQISHMAQKYFFTMRDLKSVEKVGKKVRGLRKQVVKIFVAQCFFFLLNLA